MQTQTQKTPAKLSRKQKDELLWELSVMEPAEMMQTLKLLWRIAHESTEYNDTTADQRFAIWHTIQTVELLLVAAPLLLEE